MADSNEILIHRLAECIETAAPEKSKELFSEDSEYRDVAFGTFKERAKVVAFISSWFDEAENFTWRFYDIVADENKGYAKYYMRYDLTSPRLKGKQIEVTAFSYFEFASGRIRFYDERLNLASPLLSMAIPDRARFHKLRQRARWDAQEVAEVKNRLGLA